MIEGLGHTCAPGWLRTGCDVIEGLGHTCAPGWLGTGCDVIEGLGHTCAPGWLRTGCDVIEGSGHTCAPGWLRTGCDLCITGFIYTDCTCPGLLCAVRYLLLLPSPVTVTSEHAMNALLPGLMSLVRTCHSKKSAYTVTYLIG